MTSPWKTLSWITGLVIFFSGLNPATADAKSVHSGNNQKLASAIKNSSFACQSLTLRIADQDRENIEFLIGSRSHIDVANETPSSDQSTITISIQSLMWVPGRKDFREDVEALLELESIEIQSCKRQL